MPKERIVPSDIVAALIFLTRSQLLLADPQRFHRALAAARNVCPLLDDFYVSHSGVQTRSRSFDEALAVLKLSRVVRMENTDYERYLLDESARKYIEQEILPRFTAEEQRSLEGAAAIVREECGAAA